SGRSGRSRKPLYPYGYPGFESLSFRKKKLQVNDLWLFFGKTGMRTLEGFVIAQRFRSEAEKESLSFRNIR
ncbi:MAG: hypothetical protein K2K36_03255, partial [Muribaculaceae bacterium]|nr:hypothetical protein [Muribaculaceae bacterium]